MNFENDICHGKCLACIMLRLILKKEMVDHGMNSTAKPVHIGEAIKRKLTCYFSFVVNRIMQTLN